MRYLLRPKFVITFLATEAWTCSALNLQCWMSKVRAKKFSRWAQRTPNGKSESPESKLMQTLRAQSKPFGDQPICANHSVGSPILSKVGRRPFISGEPVVKSRRPASAQSRMPRGQCTMTMCMSLGLLLVVLTQNDPVLRRHLAHSHCSNVVGATSNKKYIEDRGRPTMAEDGLHQNVSRWNIG